MSMSWVQHQAPVISVYSLTNVLGGAGYVLRVKPTYSNRAAVWQCAISRMHGWTALPPLFRLLPAATRGIEGITASTTWAMLDQVDMCILARRRFGESLTVIQASEAARARYYCH